MWLGGAAAQGRRGEEVCCAFVELGVTRAGGICNCFDFTRIYIHAISVTVNITGASNARMDIHHVPSKPSTPANLLHPPLCLLVSPPSAPSAVTPPSLFPNQVGGEAALLSGARATAVHRARASRGGDFGGDAPRTCARAASY